jgi:endonuclease/exonuclease/phosphatase family metal-dependent hydrolase
MHIDGILVRSADQSPHLVPDSEACCLVDAQGHVEANAEAAPLARFRIDMAYVDDRKVPVPQAATRYASDHFAVVAEASILRGTAM